MPHEPEPPERPNDEAFPELGEGKTGSFIADRIAPVLRESTLWPLWLVVMAHVAAFGAWSLVLALQERRLVGMLGAFGLFWLMGSAGFAEIRQTGRPGPLCVVIALTWVLTGVLVVAARYWQIV